ncbi:MAG: maltose alpha-D-glucosyltransferase [Propionibacterium sp.]|nr:maltose alpha-D-glucosyltransferase [Propionibacterium sp.]
MTSSQIADQQPDDPKGEESPELEVTYDEARFAARPARLRPRARRSKKRPQESGIMAPPFEPVGTNPAYVGWLEDQSMLRDATELAKQLTGQSSMWANPFAAPDPRAALDKASVWYTAYPLSLITPRGASFLAAMADDNLWTAFARIGIDAIHTGPVKMAGGIQGWEHTPSIDGHFDRISMAIDPQFGTDDEFRAMCGAAAAHNGSIIDDVVPGHTGKGADFRLAELNHKDFPGIYHMIDIPPEAWPLLPEVPEGRDCVNLDPDTERRLAEEGYIIGALQRVIFYEPGVKETNWSATPPILDADGVEHRWVYLHYFKDGQPSINWLDPTFAGMRLVIGDALHSLTDLGSSGLRLDANGFLGVEKTTSGGHAWSEGHPLSEAANQLIGSMVRKVGGFTFQELNLTIDDILSTGGRGPDLSYDFVTRPAYHYALITGDTEFLRLALREALRLGIDQASLVHALQNHDELTYELVHFATKHRDDLYAFEDEEVRGEDMAERIRETMRQRITGDAAPYNAVFTQNGIACTTASLVAASLRIADLEQIDDDQARRITDAHLLLAMYNAYQPGVFALSGWDLVGALPLDRSLVRGLIRDGDTRWIERGAYDLMDWSPDSSASSAGMPKARCLYGSLPEQLADPRSFAMRLSRILEVRRTHGIATGVLLDIPDVAAKPLLVLVNRLVIGAVQVTVLNFGPDKLEARVQSDRIPAGEVRDLATSRIIASVDDLGGFTVSLPGFGGVALLIEEPATDE